MGGYPRLAGGRGPQPGGEQMDFVETTMPWQTGTGTNTTNRATFLRARVAKPITVTQITIFVGAASGNVDLGIYQSDGTTLTKIASTGSTAAAGANALQTINLTASVTLQPGVDYFFAITVDNATVSVARYTPTLQALTAFKDRVLRVDSAFPLPATVTIASARNAALVWWIAAS